MQAIDPKTEATVNRTLTAMVARSLDHAALPDAHPILAHTGAVVGQSEKTIWEWLLVIHPGKSWMVECRGLRYLVMPGEIVTNSGASCRTWTYEECE